MSLLTSEDRGYDSSVRRAGFYRYKQPMSFYGVHWFQVGLFTGVYAFMACLFWWAEDSPSLGTVALYGALDRDLRIEEQFADAADGGHDEEDR